MATLPASSNSPAAPELAVTRWFNTDSTPNLADLRGEVVVVEAFQMLCPGCVSHGLPQAQRIQHAFGDALTVLGLHTVFEHHEAMTPTSLEAFLYEYRITFPVGVDAHEPGVTLPTTMARYQLRGTPSLVVIDRAGRVRVNAFGQIEDLALGATLARLIDEPRAPSQAGTAPVCTPTRTGLPHAATNRVRLPDYSDA
jgi:peroxiredoxin